MAAGAEAQPLTALDTVEGCGAALYLPVDVRLFGPSPPGL
jgi:hypothetical protein